MRFRLVPHVRFELRTPAPIEGVLDGLDDLTAPLDPFRETSYKPMEGKLRGSTFDVRISAPGRSGFRPLVAVASGRITVDSATTCKVLVRPTALTLIVTGAVCFLFGIGGVGFALKGNVAVGMLELLFAGMLWAGAIACFEQEAQRLRGHLETAFNSDSQASGGEHRG